MANLPVILQYVLLLIAEVSTTTTNYKLPTTTTKPPKRRVISPYKWTLDREVNQIQCDTATKSLSNCNIFYWQYEHWLDALESHGEVMVKLEVLRGFWGDTVWTQLQEVRDELQTLKG